MDNVLEARFKGGQEKKGQELGQRSAEGALSGIARVLNVEPLNEEMQEDMLHLLKCFATKENVPSTDLTRLCVIAAEIRAIDVQSIFLHGARIQQARQILKEYREGAFTKWLKKTYGNRQTPYNFLQYFEFYHAVSRETQKFIDTMPRQSIYMLASRPGVLEKKEKFIHGNHGETKQELSLRIQRAFPVAADDRRKKNLSIKFLKDLESWQERMLENEPTTMSRVQRKKLHFLCSSLMNHFPNME